MLRIWASALALLACTAGDQPPAPNDTQSDWITTTRGGATVAVQAADASRANFVVNAAVAGAALVEQHLGATALPITVRMYPDRATLEPAWRTTFNAPLMRFECWMIANATADVVVMLSPRAYTCNPTDSVYVTRVVAHELVHAAHRRAQPDRAFGGMQGGAWFVEGLAGFLSGQYDDNARSIAAGAARAARPTSLASVMAESDGYAMGASIVAFIDATYGRAALRALLTKAGNAAILGALNLTESELLVRWRSSLHPGVEAFEPRRGAYSR